MLVADDDIATIEMIETIYDWTKLGINRVIRAYNGNAARDLIEREQPDIVLCDIGMPQSSGIDVLKWVHRNQVDTEFIFLTCYASFEYARAAVQYGAANYLTKPFAPEELQAVVRETIHRLEERRSESRETGHKRFMINNLINIIHKGGYGEDREKIDHTLRKWDCGFGADDRFRVVYTTADKSTVLQHDWQEDTFRYAFRHLALEAIADRLYFDLALDKAEGRYYTVMLLVPEDCFTEHALAARCEEFVRLCGQHLKSVPVCLVGEAIPLYELYPYCGRLQKMIRKERFSKGRTLLYREQAAQTDRCDYPIDRERIQENLRSRNKPALMEYVGGLVNEAMQMGAHGDNMLHQLHQDILQVVYSHLLENKIDAHILFTDNIMRELNEQAEQSAIEMMRFVASLYDRLIGALDDVAAPTRIITAIKRYIHEHFREEINRTDIAAHVYITPNYLSKLFRCETSMTLREYINRCRIDEAKRLLRGTDMTISDIAMDTGFDNMSYFSTVFKKTCGVAPLAWRNDRFRAASGQEDGLS